MQESNFERQVKDRLEEFDLPPSAPVWQKIEREIGRGKERRRILLWMLPFLFAGGAFLLWTTTGKEGQPVSSITTARPVHTEVPPPSNEVPSASTAISHSTAGTKEKIIPATPPQTSNARNITQQEELVLAGKVVANSKRAISSQGSNSRQELATGKVDPMVRPKPVENEVQRTDPMPSKGLTGERMDIITPFQDTVAITANEEQKEAVSQPVSNTPDEPVRSKKEKKEDKKWKVALQASAGYAESAESFFPLTGTGEPVVTSTSVGFTPPPTPSPLRKGLYLSAGMQFTKPLGNRVSFTTGIHYSYGSTKQLVGDQRMRDSNTTRLADPAEPFTYYNGRTKSFTNSYHFIELPAGVDLQLFSSFPLELHAGFSVSALIAGNAVHYDRNTNTYYRNNDHLRKTGINWYSGFSYGLMKNRLKIGPHIQYGFLSLNNKDTEDKNYLLLAGLRAKWMLR